jgi:hypothetical protein
VVVPGHGGVGGVEVVREARLYIAQLRDEALRLRADGVAVDTAVEQLDASFRALHPDWVQPEWIAFGVRHFYAS